VSALDTEERKVQLMRQQTVTGTDAACDKREP
jgi:hypothetical protein